MSCGKIFFFFFLEPTRTKGGNFHGIRYARGLASSREAASDVCIPMHLIENESEKLLKYSVDTRTKPSLPIFFNAYYALAMRIALVPQQAEQTLDIFVGYFCQRHL